MKKSMILGVPMVAAALLLGGCSEGDDDINKKTSDSHEIKTEDHKKYDLVYAEVLNSGNAEYPREEIKCIVDGKPKTIHTKVNKVYEHVLDSDEDKPYVIKKDGKYHIYRPPYMIYGNDDIEGTVKDKKELTNDSK